MNAADLVIAIILLIGLLSGLARGLVRGLLGLAGLVLGIVLASGYYELASETFLTFIPGEAVRAITGFLIIFALVVVLVGLLSRFVAKAVKISALGWFDGLLGGVLGLVIAAIISGVIILLTVMAGFGEEGFIVDSRLAPKVLFVTDAVVALLPEDARETINEQYEKLRKEWRDAGAKRARTLAAEQEEAEEPPNQPPDGAGEPWVASEGGS
jgi:membrane protein required for colicin V production